jgi:predicted acetyltransferase
MNITIEQALAGQKDLFAQLANLYNYDFSEYLHNDVNENGFFYGYYPNDFWTDPKRKHYFIRVDGKLAGFVIVRDGGEFYLDENAENTRHICEFFVMKKYRLNGVGRFAANAVLDMFKGTWEVCQLQNNIHARKFWKSVISGYTGNNYQERGTERDKMVGFIFDNIDL